MITGQPTSTKRLLISGAVQGVGFRPFVYREAISLSLAGWVRNTADGVEIVVTGKDTTIDAFIERLRHHTPPAARIHHMDISAAEHLAGITTFSILASESSGVKQARILPDLATCPDCQHDIRDPNNRRFRYPFTNCTNCGPRYSILLLLPYDRDHTTMRTFTLCPDCRREYEDPSDRRFHAQPNACPVCGPQLTLWDRLGRMCAERHDALLEAAQCLRNGGVVAIKGVGGFHLMVDAANHAAIDTLRSRKHRSEKPFAVMMPNLETAKRHADINRIEAEWLTSNEAPIVLVRKTTSDLSDRIAPDNPHLGIMLPYAPLHHLLMQEINRPLVATSGNLSDEPICIDEYEALDRLSGIADVFLVHNRPIAHPVDDSVMRVVLDRPLWLRVARGVAPLFLPRPIDTGTDTLLAVGAHMKSTLAIAFRDQIVVSPHIGDLETIPAWESFERNFETLEGMYDVKPTTIACDQHPDYASTHYAQRRIVKPVHIQHHHAHIVAVMAEHGLSGPVLGFAFDGTGYGNDGTIWGGEVLRVDRAGYTRVAHLRTLPLPGGDAAAREPRRSALGVMTELRRASSMTCSGFTEQEFAILSKAILNNINTARTSSMGRLFDAAASLLGLCHQSSYEGQAAMMVQAEAEKAGDDESAYGAQIHKGEPAILDWEPILSGLIADRVAGVPICRIASRFHRSIVDLIIAATDLNPELPVVLAGGCFQNAWLLEKTVIALRALGREVVWANQLPSNDGAISVGQVVAAGWRMTP